MSLSCKEKPQVKEVDVLIIGGTTGGTAAGIQAARLGSLTLIVGESPWLGGMLTSAGVSAVDGNHHLPSGLWNEFRQELYKHYGSAEALATGWVSNTLFEPHVGDRIFKAMVAKEKNLEALYGYHLVSVQKENNRVIGATFENEQKQCLIVRAKVVIDATDLGDAIQSSGATYRLGMDSRTETGESPAIEKANDIVQDLTWVAILKDYGEGVDKTIRKPEQYHPELFRDCCRNTGDEQFVNCAYMLNYGRLPNRKYMINWPKFGNDVYLNVVEMNREDRLKALKKAKEQTLSFIYYIQTELGFKHLGLADDEFITDDLLAYEPYYREGRRLKGIVTLTFNHVEKPYDQKEALFKTGISVGDYPVDHHHKCNPEAPDLYFLPVPSFNIPLGSLIPESINGLIVADKAISVTNLINGSTRLQPCVLLTGQAAGALAGLSILENKEPREISVRKVQQTLLDAGAYIMPLYDVKPGDSDFIPIQKITATGIIRTTGEPWHWANRTWFYPDSTLTTGEFLSGLAQFGYQVIPSEDNTLLTWGAVFRYLNILLSKQDKELNFQETTLAGYNSLIPVRRRELAVLLDKYLHPFEIEIKHNGSLTFSFQ